ncbi:MAG TPA: hypothetical protein EYH31_09260 [Anaerolineae bacterium]|nr:hypothetical protein [Anaerolineae bacterium]
MGLTNHKQRVTSNEQPATMLAGFGKSVITPRVGVRLVGYFNRQAASTGVHDDLHARALVLEANGVCWALCAVELCYVREPLVAQVRALVDQETDIPGENVFIAAIHTHSGPDDQDTTAWDRPLAELIAAAIIQAGEHRQPARIGGGFGVLYGHNINRRWLERPVDPAVGVIRVDGAQGRPLGMVTNFGCHAVVLGYDNLLISADWPGYACRQLEAMLGEDAVCLFVQGGSGDANPLTQGVRARLTSGHAVSTFTDHFYYGLPDDAEVWNIGDRGGGTFEEAAVLGQAMAEETLRVAHGIQTTGDVERLWARRAIVNGARPANAPSTVTAEEPSLIVERPVPPPVPGQIPLEIMGLGVDGPGIVLVGQPGEIFSETAVHLRRRLQTAGVRLPLIVGYANGWQVYLPPPEGFVEGGYEVRWAEALGLSSQLQTRIEEAVMSEIVEHPRANHTSNE